MLSNLNHPNVLRFYGVVVESYAEANVIGIMTEYMKGGSLAAFLRLVSLSRQMQIFFVSDLNKSCTHFHGLLIHSCHCHIFVSLVIHSCNTLCFTC